MRPEIFLYQAGGPPIIIAEQPVTPVLQVEEYVELTERELIEGGAPFQHYVPEVVIAPCWVQDLSIAPVDRPLIDGDLHLPHQVAAPVVYRDSMYLDDAFPERRSFEDDFRFDPSPAANVIIPIWKLDWISDVDVPPREVDLIEGGGSVPLREVAIVPLAWFAGSGDIDPRVLELIGAESHSPLMVVPPVLMDWFVQQPDLPAEVRDLIEGGAVSTEPARHVPQIHAFYEGLSRDAVRQLQQLIADHFQTQITITATDVFVKICSVSARPALGVDAVSGVPALGVEVAASAPAIRIDSADSDPVC